MKTPKEWFEEELSGEPLTQESVIEVIKMVQEETWNEAIDKAAESVELTIEGSDYHSISYQDLIKFEYCLANYPSKVND